MYKYKLQHTCSPHAHTQAEDTKKNKFYCWKGGGWILYLTLWGEVKTPTWYTCSGCDNTHTSFSDCKLNDVATPPLVQPWPAVPDIAQQDLFVLTFPPASLPQSWLRQMVSCPAAQFSILLLRCMDSLAGWLSSLCRERLANNLSGPVGYEASMSTTGPVFLRPAMEIREPGWSGQSEGKGGWEKWEGRRAKGSKKGERVVFLGPSQGGNVAQTVFCNSHGH